MNARRFKFPAAVAGAAFLLYALTLAHGVTFTSLPFTAKVAGWDWLPPADRPLAWLLTLPLRLLPAAWIACALNLFAAALAALTLGILARSVELLPWDCAPDAKKIWESKIPALLAAAVCGLEFNFWLEATAMSGEMVDLLLLSAAIWCLLEFRAAKKIRWLDAAAVLWGLGMAENWVMLATLPVFAIAVAWLRGLDFFERKFLRRTALLVLAGFSIYLLPVLAGALNPRSPWTPGQSWLATFHSTRMIFSTLRHAFWSSHRLLTVAVLLYFLVPALSCLVRIKNESVPNQPELDRYQIWFFRALRLVLLFACLWLAFDPVVGPREIIRRQLGLALPLVTFDYLDALGAAFLAGSLLFAAQIPPQFWPRGFLEKLFDRLRQTAKFLIAGLAAIIAGALLARNFPAVWQNNRLPLQTFGETLARALPAGGGIVLGKDPLRLAALRAALAHRAGAEKWGVADLQFLPDAKYRAALGEKFSAGGNFTNALKLGEVLQLLDRLARTNRIYFLEPHDGEFIFELFQPQPLGAVSELKVYRDKNLSRAVSAPEIIAAGEKFWDEAWHDGLQPLGQTNAHPGLWKMLHRRLALEPARRASAAELGRWYSAALDDWGVFLQTQGDFSAAKTRFEQALFLNADNFAAAVNLDGNSNLLAGKSIAPADAGALAQKFQDIRQVAQAIAVLGDFDEPTLRYAIGNACLAAGWPRQAWREFDRAHTLAPDALAPQLALAQIYSRLRMDDAVFEITARLREKTTNSPAGTALETELALLEAKSWISRTNAAAADRVLSDELARHPDDVPVAAAVFKAYLAFGDATNALGIIRTQLAKNPDNIAALNNQGALLIETRRAAEALPVLNHALALTNVPSIQVNRAIAEMQLQNFDAAEKDYLELENSAVDQFSVHLGLAEIAEKKGATNAAIEQLKAALTNAPAGSLKWQQAGARLETLKNPGGN